MVKEMAMNLREIIKKTGITQQELADYLGITRQYLSNYLDETYEEPKLPKKYMDNILFLFECRTREDFFSGNFKSSARHIRKRILRIKQAKDSIDRLFNMENEEKFEIFQVLEYLHALIKLDAKLLEALSVFLDHIINDSNYRTMLTYLAKRYLIIDFDDESYNDPTTKAREALLYKAFESEELDFSQYEELYYTFVETTKRQNNIDVEALKDSLSELGYTNISQKDLIEIIKKYNQLKNQRGD